MASQIREPSDLWDLEHYLTGRRKESTASRMGFLVLQIIHLTFCCSMLVCHHTKKAEGAE